ncbi:mechanosensitive ion channel [Shewanella sp. 1_MG-2023]|uniref:mechanosensitive ion channel family protein n=1 Tax=unclassified Shewanella TaxID=196818 RepID=UPI0026E30E36|nr:MULTISPECIES: mechanosensitive ion channel domain-containing protein [unclassified Shewanella]MDO6610462.1 mechanosensitive ion channel [Shewanella sp. 7_MG-2023]MDO6770587.1 mechanosensitive ion channel [Shewanella sp. 2_MG-2023]MDO6794973.1 mechanosensitive ion channel [Shewanella sp. 1_MG-2023]
MDDSRKALQAILDIISFDKLLAFATVCLFAWLLMVIVQFVLKQLTIKLPKYRLLWSRLYPFARLFVWATVMIYTITEIIDPHENLILAVIGSIGIVLGLATQEPAKNMIAGLIIMITPPYRVGDMVTLSGHYGEVIQLDWSVTWLRTFDDNTVMVPNAEALKTAVSNANSGALDEMVVVTFKLPISVDHLHAIQLAKEATQCSPYTFLDKPITVNIATDYQYGEHLITLTVKAYVMDIRLERKFASDINLRVINAFKQAQFYPVTKSVTSESIN